MLIKTKILVLSKKNGIYVVKLHTANTYTKFQSNILIFGCAMVKKNRYLPKVYDVFFLMQFLVFLVVVRKNKEHFWNPETKLDKISMFLEEIYDSENLTFFELV